MSPSNKHYNNVLLVLVSWMLWPLETHECSGLRKTVTVAAMPPPSSQRNCFITGSSTTANSHRNQGEKWKKCLAAAWASGDRVWWWHGKGSNADLVPPWVVPTFLNGGDGHEKRRIHHAWYVIRSELECLTGKQSPTWPQLNDMAGCG